MYEQKPSPADYIIMNNRAVNMLSETLILNYSAAAP